MSPRILKSLCIWVLILILHNVHGQARVLSCGGGGVRNSDTARLQEGAGKIMELEKSQLNWVYCYLDSGLIHFPLLRIYLRHFQRCRAKTARRFRSRFASLRPEWSWWRRPRRCATRRSRWPICNPLQHHHHHPHHHYQGRGDHSSNDHNWSSSHQSCKEARWEIFFRLLSKRSLSENSDLSVVLLFLLLFPPPSFKEVPLIKILVRQQLPSPAAWGH